jgi:plastocyanin
MIKKEGNIALIFILVIVLIIIGIFMYEQINIKEEISRQGIQPPIIEKPIEEPTKQTPIEEKPVEIDKKEITILISRFDFDKPEIVIEPGTKVIWKNTDDRRHMITNKRLGLFRTMRKSLEQGDTFEYVFTQTGTYEILEANFGINGKVIVEKQTQPILITGGAVVTTNSEPISITGYVVKNMEVNGIGFFIVSINIFLITMIVLVAGFYISKRD